MSILSRIFGRKPSDPVVTRKSYFELLKTVVVIASRIADLKKLCAPFKEITGSRYKYVEHLTGVPADVIFAIHYREASLDFKTCLHNGDPLPGPTTHVPKGRGPFLNWESACADALLQKQSIFPKEWDIIGKLEFCEAYNGLGYKKRGLPSPYNLSWTNEYQSGKYVADGKFDPNFVDKQCGVLPILLELNY